MSDNDYWQMIKESKRREDSHYDKNLSAKDQLEITRDLTKAHEQRNEDKLRWMLNVPQTEVSDCNTTIENKQVTLSLKAELAKLIENIHQSKRIPEQLIFRWNTRLISIVELEKSAAIRCITDFKVAFENWVKHNRPPENIRDIGNRKIRLFETEMLDIETKINRIKYILKSTGSVSKS